MNERILVSNWYPEEDYLALVTALTDLLPSTEGDTWEMFGRVAAQHDLTTVYRSTVRQRTLIGMLRAVRDLFHMYHDTGRIEIQGDETRAHMDFFDYASISAGHCRFVTSYIREQLRVSIGHEIDVRETLCCAAGDDRCRARFHSLSQPRGERPLTARLGCFDPSPRHAPDDHGVGDVRAL